MTILAALWGALALVWLVQLVARGDARPRWMHMLHALAPLAALAASAAGLESAVLGAWLLLGAGVWLMVTLAWIAGTLARNHGIMDVAYPFAALVPALALHNASGGRDVRMSVVVLLLAIWAIRLGLHIARTNLPRGETQPYAKWRALYAHAWWWRSYFQVHLLQGVMVWLWLAPVAFVADAPGRSLGVLDYAAIALWAIGFAFQAAGDRQLRMFKRDPANRGRVMTDGVWSLTRHPNYFGESMMWGALALFGLEHPHGALGFASALYALWFMAFGSATPMLERHLMRSKPGYAEYAARVPRFFPFSLKR